MKQSGVKVHLLQLIQYESQRELFSPQPIQHGTTVMQLASHHFTKLRLF